jgi:hypothetical protein
MLKKGHDDDDEVDDVDDEVRTSPFTEPCNSNNEY